MYCRECGENIPDDSVYCPECGKLSGAGPATPNHPLPDQPPPYQPPPYQPPHPPPPGQTWRPAAGAAMVAVPNYLVQSILVTVLCCLPAGIVAIVNASQANSKQAQGDYAGAVKAANTAKTWCWVAVGAGAVVAVVYFVAIMMSTGGEEF